MEIASVAVRLLVWGAVYAFGVAFALGALAILILVAMALLDWWEEDD